MKPCINLTIDKDLLDKLEQDRFKRIQKEQKDISRSSYISELIRKGLNK
ncbi:hypothetical protein [Rossellomorea vietnamensis]|nr:hypothetical protein [Rossellomorea vietnamensis]